MVDLIGKKATFTPNVSGKPDRANSLEYVEEKTGVVDYVNEEHRYFRVKYEVNGCFFYECFKFSQIGADKDVVVHG